MNANEPRDILEGMTGERWQVMTPAERERQRDNSQLHPKLVHHLGKRVRVEPKREYGRSTFRVGQTTGWRPVLLAMRSNARGSSDIIRPDEIIYSVTVLD